MGSPRACPIKYWYLGKPLQSKTKYVHVSQNDCVLNVNRSRANSLMNVTEISLLEETRTTVPDMPDNCVDNADQKRIEMPAGSQRKLVICAIGVFVCYFYYGILQEKITRGQYGDGEKAEKFTFTLSLVFVQCIVNASVAFAAVHLMKISPDKTPTKMYLACSLSYLGAMLASNQSLQHISYPKQVLGKSAKPIPVMLLGVLLAHKRYPLVKYLFILMIVIGVALFMFKDQKVSAETVHESNLFGIGEVLLLVSLTLDGVTGAVQERMRSESQTHAHHMMFNVNLWSILWLFLGILVSGEGLPFLSFVGRYPYVIWNILSFSIASAIGQIFIFVTLTTFGPLTCSIITTTRKFFTILGSIILFQNSMSSRQWLGTAFVFAGLGLDSKYGKAKRKD